MRTVWHAQADRRIVARWAEAGELRPEDVGAVWPAGVDADDFVFAFDGERRALGVCRLLALPGTGACPARWRVFRPALPLRGGSRRPGIVRGNAFAWEHRQLAQELLP